MTYATRSKPKPPAPKRRWGRLIGVTLLAIVLLVPVLGYAALKGWVPAAVVNAVARVFVRRQEGALPWHSDQPANVLIMGLQVGGASVNPLTDSMMIASYQPGNDSFGMLSIPRDLWVEMPGNGSGRINEAFEYGGAAEAMLTVQQNLGVPVNYYALISYTAFEKLIDDAGGVTVDVPYAIDDPTFPAKDEIHFEPFKISKGVHHLDGHEALRYVRTRHADSDFGRAQRQQQVLMALKSQMLKPANWFKLPLLLHDARSMIRTNFPMDQGVGLGLKVLQLGKEGIHQGVLSPENRAVQDYTTSSGAQVLIPNKSVVKPLVENMFQPSLSLLRATNTVRVDNGNGYKGAATGFGNVLAGLGAKVLPPGDADRTDYPVSKVLVYGGGNGKLQEARLIAGMLSTTVEERSGKGPADIVVVLGRDYAPFVKFGEKDWADAMKPR